MPISPLTCDDLEESVREVTNLEKINELIASLGGGGSGDAVSVMDHGAVGDGVADDTASVTAAVAAALAADMRLHFPAGTYKLTSAVAVAATSGIYITGREATIRFASATPVDAFEFAASSTRVKIEGLAFLGDTNDDKDVNTGVALDFAASTTDVDILGCTFTYCRPVMVAADNLNTGRFSFRGNRVLQGPNPVSTSQYSIIESNWFVNTAVVTTRTQAVYLFGAVEGCIIRGNVFKNIAGQDIQIRSGSSRYMQKRGFVIADNYHENSYETSLWCGSDTYTKEGGFTITGNVYKNCLTPIKAIGLGDSIISNNLIEYDWEYPGALDSGYGIALADGGAPFSGSVNPSKCVLISHNAVHVRHPFFGVLTMTAVPTDGEQLVVGSTTYTWKNTAASAGHIEIVPGDVPDCFSNLLDALTGMDGLNSFNPVLRDMSDAFYNAFSANGASTDKFVIASRNTFTFTTTATNSTCAAVIDGRRACPIGIEAQRCLWPVLDANIVQDVKSYSMSIQNCREPTVTGNVLKGGAPIFGNANALSVYRGNRFVAVDQLNTSAYRMYRQLLVKDGFPVLADNGIVCEQEYTTRELTGVAGRVTVGDGRSRCFLFYGTEVVGVAESNSLPFRWNDGDTLEFRGTGKANLDLTFKRTAPGANEFNSRASLIAAINASADWGAAAADYVNVGGTPDPGNMVELYVEAAGVTTDCRVYVTTKSLTCGVVLVPDGLTYSLMIGGCAGTVAGPPVTGATKTAVFSPLANDQVPVFVQGVNAASAGLNPKAYLADAIYGVGYVITHDASTTGTEEFAFQFPGQ